MDYFSFTRCLWDIPLAMESDSARELTCGKLIIFTGIMDSSSLHHSTAGNDIRSREDNSMVNKMLQK